MSPLAWAPPGPYVGPLRTGDSVLADRYELDHEIGRGGMGAVWLAHDTLLDRTVAIKQIGKNGGSAPDFDRAEREAHLAARVNHHGVVAVFDLVYEDGGQWLVMEHVDGPTLGALVTERGAIEPDEMARIVEQVAGALAAAHDHGIVHRDVKPSNILLTRSGAAKLSDFGIARAQADASLTQTGLVTGSPAYLSPEVATGQTATAASDVWSLGATVFHALSGRAPYEVGDNVLATMYRIVNEEPPRLEDSGHLGELVTSMMQQDPGSRPTMLEVQSIVAGQSSPTTAGIAATQTMAAMSAEADPTPTSAFRPLAVPVVRIPAIPEHHRRLWWAGGAVAALLATVLLAATVGARSPAVDIAAASPKATTETKAAPDPTPTPPQEEASPVAETDPEVARIEGFATDYLTAASNNPKDGFAMLTEKYQKKSGGFEGYNDFWSDVSNLDVTSVEGDPKKKTVAYTYSYDFDDDDRRTEKVVLKLKEKDSSYLIDGAS